ncbi:MAG: HAMP domain-containing histidine kinase [Proteobacteria bacterium]|nr:HAMP domain-containing histidine kinase [Pseudomonadota bacterium]
MFQSVLKDRISSTPAGQDETVQSLFERMNDCFLALKGLFDSLLDISKLDSQTMKPNITEFSLLNLMSRILSRYDGLAQVKELEFKIYAPDFKVLCDETLLSQILSNFVGNAIRYTESGKVQFRAYQRANQICIEVQDTGVGIPPDKIKGAVLDNYLKYSLTHCLNCNN